MFCRNCGENIPVDSVFCPNCGKNLLDTGAATHFRQAEESAAAPEEEAGPRWRRSHGGTSDVADEDEEELRRSSTPRPHINLAIWERLGLMRLLWGMGLLFSAVGFVVGLSASPWRALSWILFGVALILAAPHAPQAPEPDTGPPDSEEGID